MSSQSDSTYHSDTLKKVKLTSGGRLDILSEWNKEIAIMLAEKDGLELKPSHWEILNLLRAYYTEYNISPIKKLLKKEIIEKLPDGGNKASDAYLESLFPNGVLTQGTKIAGLPVPMLDAEIEGMHVVTREKSKAVPAKEMSHFVGTFEFEKQVFSVTEKGNLVNPADWNERLAEFMASKEHIRLTPDHWEVINYLRKFYFNYGITPMVRLLMKHMRRELGEGKSSHDYLYHLFPGGPSRQGSRIAGLPEPQGCIDN